MASAIGHMGFWDRWQALRWGQMLAGEWSADSASMIEAEHLANAALEPYWAETSAAGVPALAVEAASRLDALVSGAPDSLIDALEGTPSAFLIHRHRHRDEHLDQIERGLAAASNGEAVAASPAIDRAYLVLNESSRARLGKLITGLTASDLALAGGEQDWTVGQILGHLAFWDRFLAARWRAALAGGRGHQPLWYQHEIADQLNDGLAPIWGALAKAAPAAAVAETIDAADAVDGLIAGLPDGTPFAAILAERRSLLDRSIHRREHIASLERVLATRSR